MNKELFLALETGPVPTTFEDFHRHFSHLLCDISFRRDTPLHIAAREGHQEIVAWILQEKPSLTRARNRDDNTPLHEAARNRNPDLVKILLQYNKCSAYKRNKFGETALIIASKYGHVETVKLLIEAGSNKNAVEWVRSLKEAVYRGYTDVVKAILDNPFKDCLLNTLRYHIENIVATPILHAAVQGGHLEIVEVLSSHEWNRHFMEKKDELGRCAIHVAAMIGHWDIINEFMTRWPDCVEIRSTDYKSVLHFAVEYNQFEVVRNLLLNKWPEKVVELVSRDHDLSHNTALHLAARKGVDPQLLEYLVSFPGVEVNALNNEGTTALDIAAAAQHNPNCAIIVQKLEAQGGIRSGLLPKSIQGRDNDTINTHMVVASLIATITFAAIFQIPGGIVDDTQSIHYGAAKMALHKLFRIFIFFDIAAFSTSLAVVLAWLVRQQFPDTYFGGPPVLSHVSGVTLPVSIVLTMVAFVSATVIVTIPQNYDNLKSKDKEAFSIYKLFWQWEIFFASFPPLFGVSMIFFPLTEIFFRKKVKSKIYSPTTISILCCIGVFFGIYATLK